MSQAQSAKNYFSIDSVSFNDEDYFLAWSSFSNENFYKQEYLRKGEDFDRGFNKMILIDVLHGDFTPKDIALKKAQEIEARKKVDAVANYKIIDNPNTGEYIIDFLMSDSEGALYEFNIYRYQAIETPKGKAVMLFGLCQRSFANAELPIKEFFSYLQNNRMTLIKTIASMELPEVTLVNE